MNPGKWLIRKFGDGRNVPAEIRVSLICRIFGFGSQTPLAL